MCERVAPSAVTVPPHGWLLGTDGYLRAHPTAHVSASSQGQKISISCINRHKYFSKHSLRGCSGACEVLSSHALPSGGEMGWSWLWEPPWHCFCAPTPCQPGCWVRPCTPPVLLPQGSKELWKIQNAHADIAGTRCEAWAARAFIKVGWKPDEMKSNFT